MTRRAALFVCGLLATTVACAARQKVPAPEATPGAGVVAFTEAESMARLGRSRHAVDFFHLANQFEGQTNRVFCGPTTVAIVLNTIRADDDRIEKPSDPSLLPAELRGKTRLTFDPLYKRYTQHDIFDARTDAVKTRAQVLGQPRAPGAKPDPGIQLRQLHDFLGAQGLDSRLRVADQSLSDRAIHDELVENLGTADDYVIVNFYRPAVGQQGGGHISPLGAWDERSDSFLLLDVNPNGHDWVWVPSATLIRAMRTFDAIENRGYLLVHEGRR